jgi:5'-3' exonuclease
MIKPDFDYVLFKAIKGDRTDNVNGISGYGDKKAASVLNNYENFFIS